MIVPNVTRERREKWIAEHGPCGCGSTEDLRIVWAGSRSRPADLKDVFRRRAEVRDAILDECKVVCHACWVASRPRNDHGGGKTGIRSCYCGPCKQRRKEYYAEQSKAYTKAKRKKFVDDRNAWRKSVEGRSALSKARTQLRLAYLADKVCAECGGTDRLIATWRDKQNHPYSSTTIWGYSDTRREELLAECTVICRPCLAKRVAQAQKQTVHGAGARGVTGCNCGVCVARRSEYRRDWYARQQLRRGKGTMVRREEEK